jgi:hypothetical protein
MAENEEGFVSVVGVALIQPIFDLVEKLESMKPVLPNEVKTGQHENGYSLATIPSSPEILAFLKMFLLLC